MISLYIINLLDFVIMGADKSLVLPTSRFILFDG